MIRLGKSEQDLQELYRTHYGRVRRTLQGMIGNSSIAEELTQDTFLKAWSVLPQFGFKSSLYTWIYQVALNTGRDWLRSHRNQQVAFDLSSNEVTELTPEMRAVQESLTELDEDNRTLLVLYYYEGLTTNEIGKILKLPEGTIKSRLFAAKGKLRPLLLAKGFDV